MGKGQNLTKRQQKERDEEEKAKIAALQQKAAAMGLTTYRNEEIIDDVDPELVQESFANSLLAWIPYTTAWRKAQIATEALDNLKRINNERKIARKLFAMTKIGQHEEVRVHYIDVNCRLIHNCIFSYRRH
jgi:precorrin-4 methylase